MFDSPGGAQDREGEGVRMEEGAKHRDRDEYFCLVSL